MKILIKTNVLIFSALLGLGLAVLGVVLGYRVFPSLVTTKVWESAVLKEDTQQWSLFKKIPFPLQVKVYFFNVENPDAILQGAKPVVREVGPYVYKLLRWKDEISVEDDEISYYDYMRFDFDAAASGHLSDEDLVTILNSPFNGLILAVEELSVAVLETVNSVLPTIFKRNNGLFVTAKVKELLFDGLIICENGGEGDFTAKMVCDQFKAKIDIAKSMSIVGKAIKYSFLDFKNNTHLGRLTIKSGTKVKEEVSTLVKYNNDTHVAVWRSHPPTCNEVRSTTTFRPFLTTNMSFDVFSEDICRKLKMVYQKTVRVKGIDGFKFVVANNSFDEPDEKLDNFCYCVNRSRTMDGEFGCLKSGVLDLTNCVGAPVLLSSPHLLYGDKEYIASVDGLHPNPELHQTFVTLEPTSGVPLQVAKRVQFNMFIRAVQDILSIENVTNALVPIFWIEESMTLDDKYVSLIKKQLLSTLQILEIVKWGLIGLGVTAVVVSTILIFYKQ